METKKTCPKCSQPFSLKSAKSLNDNKDRVPLLLQCGHSICEVCIKKMLRFTEPITCKVCLCDMDIPPENLLQSQSSLYSVFSVNTCLLGQITLRRMQECYLSGTEDIDCFIDVREIINSIDTTKGRCVECQTPTQKMCKQCVIILCENCFQKTHQFHIFKSHILKNIEMEIEPAFCRIHTDKQLDYYCKECSKYICMDCVVVGDDKSCKNHDVASVKEMNAVFLEELYEIAPKVDETFRRLTKTAVDIGHHLKNLGSGLSDTKLNKIKIDIQQHFSKIHAAVQKHEQEIINIMENLDINEKTSLKNAKNDVAINIKKAKVLLNKIHAVLSPETQNKVNFSVLLEEAKEVINAPWFLNKGEEDKSPLKVTVNEDLCSLIVDYIHLEGNANSAYKLQSTAEIPEDIELPPAPSQPVFPPKLVKDVKEVYKPRTEVTVQKTKEFKEAIPTNVPKHKSKFESTTSMNSVGSDSSYKRFSAAGGSSQTPIVHPVSPYAENNYPKLLQEGSQELIYISHLLGPHDFFVQRVCHQGLVTEMLREFRNAVSLPKPFENNITKGKIYLVLNNADETWQRACVRSVDRRNVDKFVYRVFCVDFGSTETVTVEQLRICPVAWTHFPPIAMHCSLANVEPIAGSWTSEDSFLIQKIVDNKQAVIHVRRVHSASNNYNVTLECDVTTVAEGVSLAHALVFHQRAKLSFPRLPYPKVTGLMDKPKLFISQTDLKLQGVEEVKMTHIVSPDKFYVRKVHLQGTYEELCAELEGEYSLSVTSGTVYYPEVGQAYAVNIEKYLAHMSGEGWRRAIVTEVQGRQRVRVFLPDTGEVALVHYSVMRHIKHNFIKMKALATECHLAGVTPLNKKWTVGSVALLQNFQSKTLELHVEEVGRSVGVTLYCRPDGEDAVCLNREMINHKFAVITGLFKFDTNINAEDLVYTNKTPLDKPKTSANPKKENIEIHQRDASKEKTIKDQDSEAKGPIKLEVKILSCQSPSLVYVALIDQQKTFKQLFENIQDYYNKRKVSGKKQWKVGERCCTICYESKTWRRAVIVNLEKDKAKVFYSDFACVETVPVANLKELTREFASIGNAAIKCHLSGVMPAGGKEWPSLTKEFLCELVESYQRIFITKNGTIKDKSLPVELWVYHVIQGDALEPNTAEWRCLNNNIIKQGLGVSDKSQQDGNRKENSESDDTISFLSVKGSVREWLQLEPLSSEGQVTLTENPESDSDSVTEDTQEGDDPTTLLLSDWLPAEPLTKNEFTGVPTYIDNNGVIYLHSVTQQDTLHLIRKALEVRFKDPDQKAAKYTKWVVGQPCIARFYLDNKFYRGRVLKVNKETKSCIVYYVDYGNEESCSFEEMRNTIVMHNIPIQAKKCVLDRVEPIQGDWDKTTLDYIHKSIVEKNCFIKVRGENIGEVSPIDLKIDKVTFNDLLVQLEMAVYSDGSKPMMPKFKSKKAVESVVEVEADGPDYIIADDDETSNDLNATTESLKVKSLDYTDWNVLNELEENVTDSQYLTFAQYDDDEFTCDISFVNGNKIELKPAKSKETALLYEKLSNAIQVGDHLPDIKDIYASKPCIARFPGDGRWYRAEVLEYDQSNRLVKVNYVDFGNKEVIPASDVKEILEEWCQMPPATVSAQINGVRMSEDLDASLIRNEFECTFLNKGPFQAKVVKRDPLLFVELLKTDGSLVYQNLIDKAIFLSSDT